MMARRDDGLKGSFAGKGAGDAQLNTHERVKGYSVEMEVHIIEL